jgi:phosphoribosylformylglycinamidine cyclo-ligase
MLRTFNCGVGMVVIADKDEAGRVGKALAAAGETVFAIGEIVKRAKPEAAVVYRGRLRTDVKR